ncbi:MAG TPA: ion channel, partial [Chryseosolibacter sp.]|nr:ion channel [Chryseosolibacter sp.]
AWLVKVYTNHGTDPALAITVSFWVICAFAVFYFFFPSDWDVASKGKLLQNYRDFIQKNEKGYIKPFFILITGFGLSFINALTLSVNAYTTLGFGNIPTHGLARYACVIQGFIGWFMLSIFTVALINQVLA